MTTDNLESIPRASESKRRGKFLQWNIATLLLLTAVVAVWTSYFRMKTDTKRMAAELESLARMARELIINDPAQYAVVERHEQWHGEDTWEVYLPEGDRYQVHLATREIDGRNFTVRGVKQENFPATSHIAELAAGKHVISLEKDFSKDDPSVRVLVDSQPLLEAFEMNDWKTTGGHSWAGSFNESKQLPTNKPLELIRIRFHKKLPDGSSRAPDEPYNGVLLWIERQ